LSREVNETVPSSNGFFTGLIGAATSILPNIFC
jgi:hypothetical protein